MIELPSDIIHHIIGEELGKADGDPNSIIDIVKRQEARDNHTGWKMAFTVNKKINSKKLIEEIAKESRLFPFFKGDKLSFNSLKDVYAEGHEDFQIKDSDVISYKFDRTKIEDIKTRCVLLYHYDYATDEFIKSTESLEIEQTASDYFEDGGTVYNNSYYGIEGEQGDDPIEVKYIRHQENVEDSEQTITKLQQFLLAWYCQQHNTCKIKLPLSYLYAEVGDITTFPTLLNGRKAYGEDYSLEFALTANVIRNGQEILPYWMVMGVSKSLDSVTLELIQLHNLTTNLTNLAPIAVISAPTTVTEGTLVTLDGTGSSDPEGGVLSYEWTAPSGITLSNVTDPSPTFTAPEQTTDAGTAYSVSLQVTDPEGIPSNIVNHSIQVTDLFPENYNVNPAGTFGYYVTDFNPEPPPPEVDEEGNVYYDQHSNGLWRWRLIYNNPSYNQFNINIITRESNQAWKFRMYSLSNHLTNFRAEYEGAIHWFPAGGDSTFEGVGSGTIACTITSLVQYDVDFLDGRIFLLDGSGTNYYGMGYQLYIKCIKT